MVPGAQETPAKSGSFNSTGLATGEQYKAEKRALTEVEEASHHLLTAVAALQGQDRMSEAEEVLQDRLLKLDDYLVQQVQTQLLKRLGVRRRPQAQFVRVMQARQAVS